MSERRRRQEEVALAIGEAVAALALSILLGIFVGQVLGLLGWIK
jgi:hypothetical protein